MIYGVMVPDLNSSLACFDPNFTAFLIQLDCRVVLSDLGKKYFALTEATKRPG